MVSGQKSICIKSALGSAKNTLSFPTLTLGASKGSLLFSLAPGQSPAPFSHYMSLG